jgi:hypothetical protein
VYADELPPLAHIPLSVTAGDAFTAAEERVHRDPAAHPSPIDVAGDSGNCASELVAHDERRRPVRHAAQVALDLGAANTGGVYLYNDLARLRNRARNLLDAKALGTEPD